MKNFAVFLLAANILWWGWQLASDSHETQPSVQKPTEASFIQAEKKLQMLAEKKESAQVMELKSETSQTEPDTVAPAERVIESPVAINDMPWCGETGSISNNADALKILEKWKSARADGLVVTAQEVSSTTWWVHLPPFANESEAKKKLSELQEKKIDSYYMRTGELAGGISLGVFSRQQSALSVQVDLQKKGYKTELREIPRSEQRFRVQLKLQDRERLQERAIKELLTGFQQVAIQEIPCK